MDRFVGLSANPAGAGAAFVTVSPSNTAGVKKDPSATFRLMHHRSQAHDYIFVSYFPPVIVVHQMHVQIFCYQLLGGATNTMSN